jgi:hypothetical protein
MNTIARVSSDMSVPEALLPEQYFERLAGSAREMPEKRLMAAVLLDALVHLQRAGSAGAAEVRAWMARRTVGDVFSFENVCEALGINAGYLARGLETCPRIVPRRVRLARRRLTVGGRRRSTG